MTNEVRVDLACKGCHAFRVTRNYRGIPLCVNRSGACWRRRKAIFALDLAVRKRKAAR